MESEIKVGDLVRCLYNCEEQFTAGKTYTVRYATEEAIGVERDDSDCPNGWCRNHFEKVEKVSEYNIGDKLRFVGEENDCGFYTKGEIYKVTDKEELYDEGEYVIYFLTDNTGDTRHTWNEDNLKENFVKVSDEVKTEEKRSPVREVRRKEIVPGIYGAVTVDKDSDGDIHIGIEEDMWSPEELREAAHVLNQLAEALEDNV